jgi:predicted N-formylglutamate amidohydrolase
VSRGERFVLSGADGRTIVVSCEHGGNRVPAEYQELFRGHEALLETHRGWDPGTAALARDLGRAFGVEPIVADVTRLLVDLNRSAHHPRVFSELSRGLAPAERHALLARHHEPHRARVTDAVATAVGAGNGVVHLGVHSFTPVLDGVERRTDLALLYDPARLAERALAERWCAGLRARLPGVRVRRNHPYRGRADGLTTTLRRRFGADRYLGIEIEVSQGLLDAEGRFPGWVSDALFATYPDG